MKFTFWGVRGSIPVPGRDTVEFGGNTSCYSVEIGNHFIILDAGTGIRNLAKAINRRVYIILWSHFHHDHQQGLPFFPWIYVPNRLISMYYPTKMNRSLTNLLEAELFDLPLFPVRFGDLGSNKQINVLNSTDSIRLLAVKTKSEFQKAFGKAWEESFHLYPTLENVHLKAPAKQAKLPLEMGTVTARENYSHPQNGTYFYKIKEHKTGRSLVYATDTESYKGGDQNLIRFSQGADVLIHDAQFTEEQYQSRDFIVQGYGHSDYKSAVEVALAAEVKQLVLTHYDPNNNDEVVREMEADAQELAAKHSKTLKVIAAREGESITV